MPNMLRRVDNHKSLRKAGGFINSFVAKEDRQ